MKGSRIASPESKEETRRRLTLNLVFHAGSVMIAFGIAIALLGEPEWYWGAFAIALGLFVWARVFGTMRRDAQRRIERTRAQ